MAEVFSQQEHVPVWQAAIRGEEADLTGTLADYAAIVDWPGAAFWRELHQATPDAVVLLSTRSSPSAWWASASATIFEGMRRPRPDDEPFAEMRRMITDLFSRCFTRGWDDPAEAMAAYEAWNAAVRAEAPAGRLVEWQPGDGCEPLCAALDVPVPDEPFPPEPVKDFV
jgi:hypothetical protein